ncbi:MAG: V-type ATPase subunit, partial [Candidatus Diapherotrites archaeon]
MSVFNFFENSLVFRTLAFGYSNARVKAMKQSLFTEKDFKAMIALKSVEDVYSYLEKTEYRNDLVAVGSLSGRSVADLIEFALTRNFSRVLSKVTKVSPSFVRNRVSSFFERYDVNNVKVILLGKHLGYSVDKIRQLIIEGGVISKGVIEKALVAKTLRDAVLEFAGTPYGSAVAKGFVEYEKTKKIISLTEAIDYAYYSNVLGFSKKASFNSRLLLRVLKSQIDFKNVSNVLRAKQESLSES